MRSWRGAIVVVAAAALAVTGVTAPASTTSQKFTGGRIEWQTSARVVDYGGAIGRKFEVTGYERGLGYPTTDEFR